MRLHTKNTKCLIVEDDEFKLIDVRNYLIETLGTDTDLTICEAYSIAMETLSSQTFDLAIIDMSVPSHPTSQGAGSPYSFPSGGLDILFEIDSMGGETTCIILTQYTDIEIEGEPVPIAQAAAAIQEKFGILVAGCIQYAENCNIWKNEFKRILDEQ